MSFVSFISGLFQSYYGKYTYVKTITKKEEIFKAVEDYSYTDGYGVRSPLDVKIIPTGRFRLKRYEVWVAYHKKTGIPKYKEILVR